jgi:hypothetical protein
LSTHFSCLIEKYCDSKEECSLSRSPNFAFEECEILDSSAQILPNFQSTPSLTGGLYTLEYINHVKEVTSIRQAKSQRRTDIPCTCSSEASPPRRGLPAPSHKESYLFAGRQWQRRQGLRHPIDTAERAILRDSDARTRCCTGPNCASFLLVIMKLRQALSPTPTAHREPTVTKALKLQTKRYSSCDYPSGQATAPYSLNQGPASGMGGGRLTSDNRTPSAAAAAAATPRAFLRRQASDTSLADSGSWSSSLSTLDPVLTPSGAAGRRASSPGMSSDSDRGTRGSDDERRPSPRAPSHRQETYERSQSLGKLLSRTRLGGSETRARSYRSVVDIDKSNEDTDRRRAPASNTPAAASFPASAGSTAAGSFATMLPAVLPASYANVYDITPPRRSLARRWEHSVVEVTVHSPTTPSHDRRLSARMRNDFPQVPLPPRPPSRFRMGSDPAPGRGAAEMISGPPRSYDPTGLPTYDSLRKESRHRRCRRRGTAIQDVLEDCEAAERLRKGLVLSEGHESDGGGGGGETNASEWTDSDDARSMSRSLCQFLL